MLFITLSHSVSFLGEDELVVIIGSAQGEISRGRRSTESRPSRRRSTQAEGNRQGAGGELRQVSRTGTGTGTGKDTMLEGLR